MSHPFKTFVADVNDEGVGPRPVVVGAIRTILSRIRHGYDTTAIVLPPRVGKSNVQRAFAIEAMEIGLIGAVVCLAPWSFLAEQLNDEKQIAKMQQHHRMNEAELCVVPVPDMLSGAIDPRFYMDSPRRHWWTMTMAQAQQPATRIILQSVATYFNQELKRPLVVFIDESHQTSSGPDGWGKLANELREAGAHLVLLTGTPERADNVAPFGFRVKELDRDGYDGKRIAKKEDGLRLETITADKVAWELDPDYQMSLRRAWGEGLIAKIDSRRFAFDSDGKDVTNEGKTKARRALSQALRDPEIVAGAIRCLLEELRTFRQVPERRETAAIVFVGSDRPGDESKDFECRQAKRIIESLWSEFFPGKADVKIATMSDDGGKRARNIIERFVGNDTTVGIGDVLIVKQMGGVGLDAPRIKLALDLSTVRTKSNATQRWLRIATKWGSTLGRLIIPDDRNTRDLYDEIIKEQGGDSQYSLENVTVVDSVKLEPEAGPEIEPPLISDFRRNGSVDMALQRIDADTDILVDAIFAQKPELASIMSRSLAAELIASGHLVAQPVAPQPTSSGVFDAKREVETRKATINRLCTELANKTARYSSSAVGNEQWISAKQRYMMLAKSHAGITAELSKCRDIGRLDRAIAYLTRIKEETEPLQEYEPV